MAKIKKSIARAKSIISIKTYKKPTLYIILFMVFINLAILTIAAIIAFLIDDSFTSLMDAFANGSVKWMLTPNAILVIENHQTLVLAVIVLITGLVLFSGTIIALTTNSIKEYVQKKNQGSGKVHLEDHIVILNWNSKVPELVADLLFVESIEVTVMILAKIDKSFAEKQIINALHQTKVKDLSKINVLVKQGDPLLQSDVLDISITKARTILIMNPDHHDLIYTQMSKSDLDVIKTVLSIGQFTYENDPPFVVEIKHFESKSKIKTLSKTINSLKTHQIMPVCFDKRLGQIIAQTLIEHRIEDVYLSLFSFDGSEIYEVKNQTIESCLKNYSHSVPLAYENNQLFVLSLSNHTKNHVSKHIYDPIDLIAFPMKDANDLEIYIIGQNNKLAFILESFRAYEDLHQCKYKSHAINDDALGALIEDLNKSSKQATILLLSDETQKEDALDANIINHLIDIEEHLKNPNVRVIVELLNPKNDIIVKDFNIENTIISNKIISLLISKLALFPETSLFYENLLTIEPNENNVDDQAIIIRQAKNVLNMTFPISFESVKQCITSFYKSFDQSYMIFGYFRENHLVIFEGDMHQKQFLSLYETDNLIFIKL